jgi:hypothetical protein
MWGFFWTWRYRSLHHPFVLAHFIFMSNVIKALLIFKVYKVYMQRQLYNVTKAIGCNDICKTKKSLWYKKKKKVAADHPSGVRLPRSCIHDWSSV